MTLAEAIDYGRAVLRAKNTAEARRVSNQILCAAPRDANAVLLAAQTEATLGHFAVARLLANFTLGLAPQLDEALELKNALAALDARASTDEYTRQYLVNRAGHMDYPFAIQVETVGRCNAHCRFCPHGELERAATEMSDALYEKIIRDAAAIPRDVPVMFFLNAVNEPFLDKRIFERIALLNQTIPHAGLGLYTNLNVLPAGFFEKLRQVRKLEFFNISFNAANESEYQEIMGIDFQRTVSNIRRLLEENRAQGFLESRVILSRVSTYDAGDTRFVQECASLFADFECGREFVPVCRGRADWLGRRPRLKNLIPFLIPCQQWLNLSVHCNGEVPHCCMDAHGVFPIGNVKERPLLEIYNQPSFRNYRETLAGRETVYPCNTCSLT